MSIIICALIILCVGLFVWSRYADGYYYEDEDEEDDFYA